MSSATIHMTAPPDVYAGRRAALASGLRRPIVLFSGHGPARNYASNPHPFRAGSSYVYFGGPPVENAALLIEPGSDGTAGCTLFRPPTEPDDLVWLGATVADAELATAAGLSENTMADPDQLAGKLNRRQASSVCPPFPNAMKWSEQLGLQEPDEDELLRIIDLRLVKDEHELRAMRRAAHLGVRAHQAAAAAAVLGARESEVGAAMTAVLVAEECDHSFTPIITQAGEVLHASGMGNTLEVGRLLLIDAGAHERTGYASDITRTYPIGGSWSTVQRRLYETVLRAEKEAIAACVPGVRFRDIHELAARVICEGLVEADLLRGDPAELAGRYAHTLFFCHGLGHLIGLDVHDMEDFGDLAGYAPGRSRRPEFGNNFLRLDRDLEPGMAMTIEPGLYLSPAIWTRDDLVAPFSDAVNRPAVDALLAGRFGGIRIEDDLVVREADAGGPEVLTQEMPKEPDEVAARIGVCA